MGFLISAILAYLLGSLCFAIIIPWFTRSADPRMAGSGNAGATNTLRLSGKKAALYVLVADGLKGLLAIFIGFLSHLRGIDLAFIGLFAVIGHIFPLYFKFQGGKGIATFIGMLLGLSPATGLGILLIWGIVAYISRYSSAAGLAAVISAPFLILILGSHASYFIPVFLASLLIIWKHRENIQRLMIGTETKINFNP